jgi:hypothetical protein
MFQLTHPRRREAPDEHFQWLRREGVPPPNTFVWLAGYEGARWSGWYMHQILSLREPGETEESGRGTARTLTTGAFVFQMIGLQGVEPAEIEKASEYEPYIVRVWPSKGNEVDLPPQLRLDDSSLPFFADPFGADNIADLLH